MKKNITVAVMAVIALMAVKAGAAELNGMKAGDVAVLAEAGSVPPVGEPARAEAVRQADPKAKTEADASRDRSPQAMLAEISKVLASGPLPGGCSLEVNAFRTSAFQPGTGDNLNVGIIKGGEYTDILMVGLADVSSAAGGRKYSYESVSCPGDGWLARPCEKNSFTLATNANGAIISVAIENAKAKDGLSGSGWKVTSAVVCR